MERIHFIGIGGISMSTLAVIAKTKGYTVTGSDRAESSLTKKLKEEFGIPVFYPQSAENVQGADRVVYTAAIADDNPELSAAREAGVPCVVRSKYLGELMLEYPVRIGVCGTHGKSSTTGMLGQLFLSAGLDPTIACGAVMQENGRAFRLGQGEHFIYEACEYKDSFLDFHPSVAVMLNVEMDHVDYFRSMRQMLDSYRRSVAEAGVAVANFDDENVREALRGVSGIWVVRVGVDAPDLDYRAANIGMDHGYATFDLMKESEKLCRVRLSVPGFHQVRNAVAAGAVGHLCGMSGEELQKGLNAYTGIQRRFEKKGERDGVLVIDDYAHHPTEIEATLKTARQAVGQGRIVCVFQPHTYSRTAGLFPQFVRALSGADKLYLAPIYAARETNVYGVSSEDLAKEIPQATALADFGQIVSALETELRPGDLLLTLGAGNAFLAGEAYLKKGDGRA